VQVGLAVLVERQAPEVALELGERAVDVDARVGRVVRAPHRDRAAPEPVAGDRPVAGVLQPLAELAVLDVLGHPGDLLVELDHAVLERRDLDEPRRHRHVDQRLPAAPAVRVGVVVGLAAHQDGARRDRGVLPLTVGGGLEVLDDEGVGVEDVQALVVVDREGEAAVGAHGHHRGDAVAVGELLVLLTEGAGAMWTMPVPSVGRHEVGGEHHVKAFGWPA
jgi:hypothetical protein